MKKRKKQIKLDRIFKKEKANIERLSTKEAADYLGISLKQLQNYITHKRGPKCLYKENNRNYYSKSDLSFWNKNKGKKSKVTPNPLHAFDYGDYPLENKANDLIQSERNHSIISSFAMLSGEMGDYNRKLFADKNIKIALSAIYNLLYDLDGSFRNIKFEIEQLKRINKK